MVNPVTCLFSPLWSTYWCSWSAAFSGLHVYTLSKTLIAWRVMQLRVFKSGNIVEQCLSDDVHLLCLCADRYNVSFTYFNLVRCRAAQIAASHTMCIKSFIHICSEVVMWNNKYKWNMMVLVKPMCYVHALEIAISKCVHLSSNGVYVQVWWKKPWVASNNRRTAIVFPVCLERRPFCPDARFERGGFREDL